MPRRVSLIPHHVVSRESRGIAAWCLSVPGHLSATGKRQRIFFRTKEQAELETERLLTIGIGWPIPPYTPSPQMHESEIWKPVPGFEFYEISSEGRLRNLGYFRRFVAADGTEYWFPHKRKAPQILKLSLDKQGYQRASLGSFGHHHYFRIHQLVIVVFLGLPPSKTHEIHHRDGDRKNNRISNLEWVTRKEHKARHIK